jgi:hypothetical protein
MFLKKLIRLNFLQSGRLNIGEIDNTHHVLKHRKKVPVIFLNKPKKNCQILYGCVMDNGECIS